MLLIRVSGEFLPSGLLRVWGTIAEALWGGWRCPCRLKELAQKPDARRLGTRLIISDVPLSHAYHKVLAAYFGVGVQHDQFAFALYLLIGSR